MRRGATSRTGVLGLGLLVLGTLAGPALAQGPAGRRPAGPLVVVDVAGKELGPVLAPAGVLAWVGLTVEGAVFPVEVAADRILVGLARVVYTTPGCQGTAFLSNAFVVNGTNGGVAAASPPPGLFVAGGIGPGNLLVGPRGAPLQVVVQSQWSSSASPPQCSSLVFIGDTEVFASEVVLDLGGFQAPFHLRRP